MGLRLTKALQLGGDESGRRHGHSECAQQLSMVRIECKCTRQQSWSAIRTPLRSGIIVCETAGTTQVPNP